jgi:N-acetylglucosamine-6-phosphate deacetylase
MDENGYFDLQLNGYGGVDLNSESLTAEDLHAACERLAADGVGGILATFVTEKLDVMERRLARLVSLRARDPLARQIISGIHIEGPFLNETEGYRGAHPADAIIPANTGDMERLLDAAGGLARLVTLAPERDPGLTVTRMVAGRGIVVSAGHTDASIAQLEAAIDAGLSMFTHCGNGCPDLMPRHNNIVQRALSLAGRLWICFIADGAHIPFFALRNYLRAAGLERTVVVTDAITAAGLGPGHYTFSRWKLEIGPDLVAWADKGRMLVGSVVTMKRSEENLRGPLGLSAAAVKKLLCDNPRLAVNL